MAQFRHFFGPPSITLYLLLNKASLVHIFRQKSEQKIRKYSEEKGGIYGY